MKRAAIYARYSSDRQSGRSIKDQIALDRAYCARHGWPVVAVYIDSEISGSTVNRPDFQDMIDDAKAGDFEIIVSEDTDRLARGEGDMPQLRRRMEFIGIEIHTVADGHVTKLHAGLKGLMDSMYLDTLALHTRRGLQGVIRSGRSAGGRAYGYRPVHGKTGEPEIVKSEAAIVRRIFDEFIAGATPRQIAHGLNRDRISPPRGKTWNASTINGSNQRGNGILRNALYVGRLEWNKVRMFKNPATGKRISRPNPKAEWQTVDVPRLAIVTRAVFDAAQARKLAMSQTEVRLRRAPKRLLSGLLRCGSCGGGLSTYGGDKTGRPRVRCTTATENGTCRVPKTFYLDTIEETVLSALKAELKSPDVIKEYLREYHAERRRLASGSAAARAKMESRLGTVRREIERLVDAIAKGHGDPAILGPRSSALDSERREIEEKLAVAPPNVVTLHPATIARYAAQIDALHQSFGQANDPKASAAIRDLVNTIVVRRGANGRPEIEITGRLNALLADSPYTKATKRAGGELVAGAGYRPTAHPIPFMLVAAA